MTDGDPPFASPGDPAARLMTLVDEAAGQTAALRKRISAIELSLELLSRELRSASIAPTPVVPPSAPEPEPEPAAAPQDNDAARLMAIELAVSGSSRGEVAARLALEYRISDASLILDDIFGAGSDDASRMPWS